MPSQSFNPALSLELQPGIIGKFCRCHFRESRDAASINGYVQGMKRQSDEWFLHYSNESEIKIEYYIPVSNIAYLEILDEKAIEELNKRNEEATREKTQKEDSEIERGVEDTMGKVEKLKEGINANKQTSGGGLRIPKKGDTDFVFHM